MKRRDFFVGMLGIAALANPMSAIAAHMNPREVADPMGKFRIKWSGWMRATDSTDLVSQWIAFPVDWKSGSKAPYVNCHVRPTASDTEKEAAREMGHATLRKLIHQEAWKS